MPIRVSDALGWRPEEVETRLSGIRAGVRISGIRAGVRISEDVASRLRDEAERTLDGMSGEVVDTARHTLEGLRKRAFDLADDLRSTANPLSSFSRNATWCRERLEAGVESALRVGGSVGEDGTVTPPGGAETSLETECLELEATIKSALRDLDALDEETAEKLTRLHASIADHGNNVDLRTTAAAATTSVMTEPLAAALKANDDGLPGTRAVARGLGPFGSALSFAIGVYGAPEDEPLRETLIAEGAATGAGLFAGMAGAAATGALVGSWFPGIGTAVGAVGGIVLAGAASFVTAKGVRDHFDDQREGW